MDIDMCDTAVQVDTSINLLSPGGYHTVPVNTIPSMDTSCYDG